MRLSVIAVFNDRPSRRGSPRRGLVTSQAASNQRRSLRVPSKIVPAAADTCRRHVAHTLRPRSERRKIGVIVLPSNQVPVVVRLLPEIEKALLGLSRGTVVELPLPR